MKDQYFGDINDYRKYGLLRTLSDSGKLRVGVCWMLTAPDGRADGQFRNYLSEPMRYRSFDFQLFDALKPCLTDPSKRCVTLAETAKIIPNGIFHPTILTDNRGDRSTYFSDFASLSAECELVFLDPDNGLEVSSVGKGHKDSCKYVYWDELQQIYGAGKSLLVYQHFCRIKRDVFISNLADRARKRLGAREIITFRTPHVLFLLIPQQAHEETLRRQSRVVADVWSSQIKVGV